MARAGTMVTGKTEKIAKGMARGGTKVTGKREKMEKMEKIAKDTTHGPTQDMVSLLLVPSGLVIWCRCVWFQVSS